MSIQKLHAFEKTSIQLRHTLKRLEVVVNNPHCNEEEKETAEKLLQAVKNLRAMIPPQYHDVDLAKE